MSKLSEAQQVRQETRRDNGEYAVYVATTNVEVTLSDTPGGDPFDPDTVAEMVRSAHNAARRVGRRSMAGHHDVEDAAQEGLLAVYEALARGNRVVDASAYAAVTARNKARVCRDTILSTTDRAAQNALHHRQLAFEQENHRVPTSREVSEMADEIRENWHDQRRRPSAGFEKLQRSPVVVDLSGPTSPVWSGLDAHASEYGIPGNEVDDTPDSWLSVQEAVSSGSLDGVKLKNGDWFLAPAMAEVRDGVMPGRGSLPHRQVATIRRTMADYPGGVQAACEKWMMGEVDAGTEALFAPFGLDVILPEADDEAREKALSNRVRMWERALSRTEEANRIARKAHELQESRRREELGERYRPAPYVPIAAPARPRMMPDEGRRDRVLQMLCNNDPSELARAPQVAQRVWDSACQFVDQANQDRYAELLAAFHATYSG